MLRLIATRNANREIAAHLGVTEETVKGRVKTRVQFVRQRLGL